MRRLMIAGLIALVASAAHAGIQFVDLGTAAPPSPPASLGGIPVQAFDQAAQAAIPNATLVTAIPGSPYAPGLTTDIPVQKLTIGSGWATWSHGYTGPVFFAVGSSALTMTLPVYASAFYFYAEPNPFANVNFTVQTESGATYGPYVINGNAGARGTGIWGTDGEKIKSVTVFTDGPDFSVAEFGMGILAATDITIPTLSPLGFTALALALGLAAFVIFRRRRTV